MNHALGAGEVPQRESGFTITRVYTAPDRVHVTVRFRYVDFTGRYTGIFTMPNGDEFPVEARFHEDGSVTMQRIMEACE